MPITLNVFNNIITSIKEMFLHLADEFKFVFINGNRYKQMITGFQNTLKITFGALIIGIVIGIIVAAVRSHIKEVTHEYSRMERSQNETEKGEKTTVTPQETAE